MKQHAIRTVYVVHHSHTDIGYTDLQEHVVDLQVDYIRSALRLMQDPANADFRWNCETLFCVEEFFKTATEEEKAQFMQAFVNIGLTPDTGGAYILPRLIGRTRAFELFATAGPFRHQRCMISASLPR